MSPNIDTNDLNTKINHAKKFLAKGARVKVTLRFRGRELAHVNASKYILDDFAKALEDVASIDVLKFVSITTQCIQQFHIDHKIFVEGFLSWNNTKYEWDNQTLLAHFQQDLKIEFEQVNDFWRICAMNTILSAR